MDSFLLFPVHLFSNIELLKNKKVYLIEEPRFFTDFSYHKLKLAYHRATMKEYYNDLIQKKIDVTYIDFHEDIESFYKKINKIMKGKKVYMYDPTDNVLKKKIIEMIPHIIIEKTLNFLVDIDLIKKNVDRFCSETEKTSKTSKKKYNHLSFYKWQRIRLNILIDKNENPIGGKWSFDVENRLKLPNDLVIPKIEEEQKKKQKNLYIEEAEEYVEKHFSKNYGSLAHFIYPTNHTEAYQWLQYFLEKKFKYFGKYQDAESMKDPFLFHSVLTPMMNIGLLTDKEVIDTTLHYYETHKKDISIESFEGFIRQIIGWRNYVYSIYLLDGDEMSSTNFFNHHNHLDKKMMWVGTTDILPIDNVILKIVEYGYAHHIERLMYLGNYLLLCCIEPHKVYEMFMEWTIDAYEWVMIPNVYRMSQFSDGGTMMTRPYFSSSNYILKMSDYKKKNEKWIEIFDALYYNFIYIHQDYLSKNYATSRQVAFWKKKSDSDKKKIIDTAHKYLKEKKMI
jgi:deoxyribodipyrimidine photolyase-related protein